MNKVFKGYSLMLMVATLESCSPEEKKMQPPNIIFVFADQLRSHELSCYGGVNIQTPNIDRLANEGLRVTNAISTYPICSPFRGMLQTGLYPLKSGISNCDHPLNPELPSFAKSAGKQGYNTAYIGKWHLHGPERTIFTPIERRLGYDHWQAVECTHDYFNSLYYENDDKEPKYWEGFDAEAQTKAAQEYIKNRERGKPFFLTLSWGPPHDPYIAPKEYLDMIDPKALVLRENIKEHRIADELKNNPRFVVPKNYGKNSQSKRVEMANEQFIRNIYAGYLAATLALDAYFGDLLKTLEQEGILDNTIVVFTSDHGDQLGSHQFYDKNVPYEESISIPFLVRYPKKLKENSSSDVLLSPIDMFPTVFGLANLKHEEVDGIDLTPAILNKAKDSRDAILLMNLTHFNNTSIVSGLDTYRGVRTKKYTYVRYEDKTPWLLFDNTKDPLQMTNLVNTPEYNDLINNLNAQIDTLLIEANDPDNTKQIYDRIIKENPERQILFDFRNSNPNKF